MSTKVVYQPKGENDQDYRWGLQFKYEGEWATLRRKYKYLWRARFEAWFLTHGGYQYRVIDTQ